LRHEWPTTVKQIGTIVCGLDLALDGVRKRPLDNFPLGMGDLGRPLIER
jgi:hypothetical protein